MRGETGLGWHRGQLTWMLCMVWECVWSLCLSGGLNSAVTWAKPQFLFCCTRVKMGQTSPQHDIRGAQLKPPCTPVQTDSQQRQREVVGVCGSPRSYFWLNVTSVLLLCSSYSNLLRTTTQREGKEKRERASISMITAMPQCLSAAVLSSCHLCQCSHKHTWWINEQLLGQKNTCLSG